MKDNTYFIEINNECQRDEDNEPINMAALLNAGVLDKLSPKGEILSINYNTYVKEGATYASALILVRDK